jgi:hypothetical protein
MRKLLTALVLLAVALAVASSCYADEFMHFKKKAGGGGEKLTKTDNFNRGNETPLGGNWTEGAGFTGLNLSSNVVVPPGSNDYISYWSADTFSADQYAQCTFANGAQDGGAAVRVSTAGSGNGYALSVNSATGGRLLKWVDGSVSVVGDAFVMDTLTGTTVYKLTIVGTTLTVYQDGVQKYQTTDTSHATGQPGLMGRGGTGVWLDNWEAGDM